MSADERASSREATWFDWAKSNLGIEQARCRAAARAATAAQGSGADFAAAAQAARQAYAAGATPIGHPSRHGARTSQTHAMTSGRQPSHHSGGEETTDQTRSPDGKWIWDAPSGNWIPVDPPPPTRTHVPAGSAPSRGLNSWVGNVTSEDLFYGQTVIVWARWILIGTGLVLSFWNPRELFVLQIQLAVLIALAFGNFYLHVQLLRGHPSIDSVVYGASAADLTVVTALVVVQNGFPSPVFIFYFAAVLGFSVAFPTRLTAIYAATGIAVYGVVCLATADVADYPAIFTRLLMIAAVAVCGNLFARNETHRRAEAVRLHAEMLAEMPPSREPVPST